jgi:uncharacterized protein (DUF433 family)
MAPDRVLVDHRIMGGVPCVAGTRIPAETVLALLAEGMTADEILVGYQQLTMASIRAVLRYAAEALRVREFPLQVPA